MCKRAVSCSRSNKFSLGITRALTFAVSEWILMFMLFIDACFSYLITRFAYFCDLQVPCLICSRLDHVLGEEKTGYYCDLICGKHKLEISSLVLCHIHDKLVAVHGMCDHCLFSFAKTNKSENYRLLVGKMGTYSPAENNDLDTSTTWICSCCNEQWISRRHPNNLLEKTSVGSEVAEVDVSLKVDYSRNVQKAIMDETPTSQLKNILLDSLSPVESQKIKLSSDNESDVQFTNDGIADAVICERDYPMGHSLQVESCYRALASKKFIPLDTVPETPLIELDGQETNNPHGSEELILKLDKDREQISETAELISFDEVSPFLNVIETPTEVSVHSLDAPGPGEMKSNGKVSEVITKDENERVPTTETILDMDSSITTNGLQMSNSLDLGDAYKLATIGSKGRQLSGKFLEQKSLKDSTRVSEDLKLLLTQLSSRGFELSLNDLNSPNPKFSWNGDEIKNLDTSSSIGMQLLQRRISLERNESGLSLDGSTISDIEGESAVDRLKRQVEHDKKIMSSLYRELEEERNASAVATYQAMAMITRLQEEKAALNMEALQCLRMMEEQAEYDGEALQRANDLLAEKEKELLDMKTELHLNQKTSTDLHTENNIVVNSNEV